jgi:SAM-dependent methyltransferase
LRDLGYSEHGVSAAMGVFDHSFRDWAAWPAHIRNCRRRQETDPCAFLTGFFLIEDAVEESELQGLLGAEAVALMRTLKWISSQDGKVCFNFFLYPLLGLFFLTDALGSNPNYLDQVYHLGGDSHLLARLAPRPKVQASLDHCTGSGVHAVLAARHAHRSFGLDINPRALDFARFNARWNRQKGASFLHSDCYEKVTSHSVGRSPVFDLITANPPFVATPEKLSLCRGGGVTGEEVTEKIVRGLPEFLSSEGIFSMITNLPVFRGQTFFDRCEAWLGTGSGWGMVVLSNHTWTPTDYILSHRSPSLDYAESFQLWLEAYESVRLEAVLSSQVYLFRSPFPWRIDRRYHYPTVAVSDFIERWIAALKAYPETRKGYRVHPGLEKIWWGEGRSRVYLEWNKEHGWWRPEGFWLEGEAALALACLQSDEQPAGPGLEKLLAEHIATL